MKRYGERLGSMGLPDSLALLRCSFFGATTIQNSKSMRGSWTHVPNSTYVLFVVERLTACLALVNKFHERLLEVYRSFKLAMQSGAFVQLILTLAAISARMDALMPEFREVLRIGWVINYQMLQILDPGQASRIKPIPVDHADAHHECVPAVIELDTKVNEVSLSEDLGSSVKRPILIAPPFPNTIDAASSHELSFPVADSDVISDDTLHLTNAVNDESLQPTVSGQFEVERRVVQKLPVKVNKTSKRRGEDAGIILPKKAKKTKRNAIDDIFDF